MAKNAYRVHNWKDYNKSLVQPGSLTFWFSKNIDYLNQYKNHCSHGNQKYSNMIIICSLTLRQLFRLPLRATERMMRSLIELSKLSIDVPTYSTLCKRSKLLTINLGAEPKLEGQHVLVDSTGIQVRGDG